MTSEGPDEEAAAHAIEQLLAGGDKGVEWLVIGAGALTLLVSVVFFGPWLMAGMRSWWGWLGGHF